MLTNLEENVKLARAIGIDRLFLKREDTTPTGSFKYRSAMRQVEHLVERGIHEGVISSSGNGAISLAHMAREEGVRLYALVSPEMIPQKLAALLSFGPIVIQSRRAMRLANYLSVHYRLSNLRPSVDDHAVIGFVALREEVEEQMAGHGGADTVYSFMTSGASMLGMMRGTSKDARTQFVAARNVRVGAQGTARSPRLLEVKKRARVVDVSDEAVHVARRVLEEHGYAVAPEAVASFAAVMEDAPKGNTVWVVSGKDWASSPPPSPGGGGRGGGRVYEAETFQEIDNIYAQTSV